MRRTVLPALMIGLFLLSGCAAPAGMEKFDTFQQSLAQAEEVSFTARVTAQTEQSELVYDVACVSNGESTELTLLAPEEVAGVTVSIQDGHAKLGYGGAILELGELSGTQLTPMTALPALITALREGHAEASWVEQTDDVSLTAVRLLCGEDLAVTAWFGDVMLPVFAELAAGEQTVLRCTIENWSAG